MKNPSIYQQKIFDWIKTGTGDAVVEAVAGSGKTTTAVAAMNLIDPGQRVLFLAFNKSIAEELAKRAPRHADCRTLNSLGHRAWAAFSGRLNLDGDKSRKVMAEVVSEFEARRFGPAVRKLVAIARSQGLVPDGVPHAKGLIPDETKTWLSLRAHHDIELWEGATDADEEKAIELARAVLRRSCEILSTIDFDDQLYLPVVFGIAPPKYDWVFVDEAQDLSPVQHRLVEMARADGGRIVAIGDSRQAIYGFRGADSASMRNFKERLGATSLELSICYRCPKSHLEMAQRIVPQIQPREDAPAGEILELGEKWSARDFRCDDLIICRASAPLVRAAYRILREKVAVRIMGRDVGAGLIDLIEKLDARNLRDLARKLELWHGREVEKLRRKDPEASTEKLDDKRECVEAFMDMFPNATPPGLCMEIAKIYSNGDSGVLTLATIHKAKGLEADRVFILNCFLMPSKGAKKPWQQEQEANLEYVALTRARMTLGFIEIERKDRRS